MQNFARQTALTAFRQQPLMLISIWLLTAIALLIPGSCESLFAADNPVVVENQKPGTSAWLIGLEATDRDGRIKGYASATSVNAGENITFYISVNPVQTFVIEIYRVGWYAGLGGRLIQSIGPLNGIQQGSCPIDSTTGMISCSWIPSYTLSTQAAWTSGIYLALLKNANGYQNYIIFVVRNDGRPADLIYQQPVTTYQAYNDYPNDGSRGKSLYEYNSYGPNTITGTVRAAKVSFDRPYTGNGSSMFLWWEVNFVRWLERSGYDVTYSTDLDTHVNGGSLLNYRGFMSVGHDEYWSRPMFDAAVTARDNRVNLAFFGANVSFWQIRFESSSSGVPNRVMVCYKDATIDPITDPTLKTVMWRASPVNRPEQTSVGVQYVAGTKDGTYAPYVVTNSSNWVYAGTGFHDGDSIPNLVGYEADRLFTGIPQPTAVPGTYVLLSHSPFTTTSNTSEYSNSSIYQAPSGAWVFASGTMGWPWALDSFDGHTPDARIQLATANVLNRFVTSFGDFTITATPSTQSVNAGNSTSYTVTIAPSGGFSGNVTLSLSGAPTGVTSTFSPNPATSSSTLSVTVAATTAGGSYPLTITAVSGSLTHTTTVTLNVTAQDFSLSATPPSQSVTAGSSASYTVTITPSNGFSGDVTLSLSGAPNGVTSSFSPNPATSSSTLSVTVAATTVAGSYPLTITGVSGSLTHSTTATLTVTAAPDFSLSATPPSRSVNAGSSASYNITVIPSGGFSGNVTLSLSGAPNGVTSSFTPNPASSTSALSVAVDATTTAGSYPLTIMGVSGSLTHITSVTLTVVAVDFSLSATPPTQSVTAGGSTSYAVTITPSGGFSGNVTLSLSGAPNGVTSSFTPNPATSSSTLSVTVDAATATGSYPLTITGVSGSLTHTTTVTLNVGAIPDFSLSAAPPSQSVTAGGSTSYAVTITPSGGFSGNVTLSVSGAPNGVTSSFTPNPATSSSTLSVTVGATTIAGSYPLTITGVSGSLTHTTTVTLIVSAAPDFSLSAAPPSQSVTAGSSTSYTVTITPSGGFSGNVTLSVSGAPNGVTSSFTPNPATSSSTLSVTVGATTIAGSYPLTITGVSGSLTHTATVTLIVTAGQDFSLSATPPSQTVVAGNTVTYAVTVSPSGGFAGQVSLTLAGFSDGTYSFTPNPTTGSSTLSILVDPSAKPGNRTLTISGTSGAITHTLNIGMLVKKK